MEFKNIRWKNLFSYGKGWTEMRLDTGQTINIVGNNGAGKSVLVEALFFALTGKPLRKCKKDQIVNISNKKDCLVELTVKASGHEYIVTRGAKPSVFTIKKDGEDLDEAAMSLDTQSYLEMVLGFSKKNLSHTLIMSTTNYIPFLRLPAADKRLFIEDILAIEIFSVMNKLVKAKLSILKDEIRDNDGAIDKLQYQLNMVLEYNKQQKETNDAQIAELEESIVKEKDHGKDELAALKKQAGELKQELTDLKTRSIDLQKRTDDAKAAHAKLGEQKHEIFEEYLKHKKVFDDDTQKWKDNIDKGGKVKWKINTELHQKEEALEYYESTSECTECGQNIDPKFAKKQLDALRTEIDALKAKITKIEGELEKVVSFKEKVAQYEADNVTPLDDQCKKLEKDMSDLQLGWYDTENEIRVVESKIEAAKKAGENLKSTRESVIDNTKRRIAQIEEQIQGLRTEKAGALKDEKVPAQEVAAAEKNQKQLLFKKLIHETTIKILSDKGIKTYIVKRYLPKLNKFVNQYLNILSAPYELSFDEELTETIALKGYDRLSYNNFSEGERQRCDIALLFAFLDIAKLKNSLTSNLLLMDEIFDRSLDDEGIRGILDIIESMKSKGFTIVNISHKHQLADKFDVTYRAAKDKFSSLEII